jgi:hypothetical protein
VNANEIMMIFGKKYGSAVVGVGKYPCSVCSKVVGSTLILCAIH